MRNNMMLGGLGRNRPSSGGGSGGLVTIATTAGTPVANNNTFSVTFSGNTDDTVAVGCWFSDGAGARTLNNATCSTGESVVRDNTSSQVQAPSTAHLEFVTINKLTSSGSRTVTITLSGNADGAGCMAFVCSNTAASAIGTFGNDTSPFEDPPLHNVVTGTPGSAVCMIFDINDAGAIVDTGAGWSAATAPALVFSNQKAGYKLNLGGAGTTTHEWQGTAEDGAGWGVSMVEIKSATV